MVCMSPESLGHVAPLLAEHTPQTKLSLSLPGQHGHTGSLCPPLSGMCFRPISYVREGQTVHILCPCPPIRQADWWAINRPGPFLPLFTRLYTMVSSQTAAFQSCTARRGTGVSCNRAWQPQRPARQYNETSFSCGGSMDAGNGNHPALYLFFSKTNKANAFLFLNTFYFIL